MSIRVGLRHMGRSVVYKPAVYDSFRKSHEIEGSTDGAQTDYQMKMRIRYGISLLLKDMLERSGINPVADVAGSNFTWIDAPALIYEGTDLYLFVEGIGLNVYEDMGLVESDDDGVSWAWHANGDPLVRPPMGGWSANGSFCCPCPIIVGGQRYMFYSSQAGANSWQIGVATTDDWVTSYTNDGANPILGPGAGGEWDDICVYHPCIIREGDTFYMFYTGHQEAGLTHPGIGLATTSIGDFPTNWVKHGSNPFLDWASRPKVRKIGDTYWMLYIKWPEIRLALAHSTDLINWTEDGLVATDINIFEADFIAINDDYIIAGVSMTGWAGVRQVGILDPYPSGVGLDELCRTDFGDVRFRQGATTLDYWIQKKVDGEYADIWVEIPTIPADPDTTTIHIYYGKADATTTESGPNTWIDYEDWEGYGDGDVLPLGDFEVVTVEEVLEVDINRAYKGVQSLYSDDDNALAMNSFNHNYADKVAGGYRFLFAIYQDTNYAVTAFAAATIMILNDTPASVISLYTIDDELQDYYDAGYHTIADFLEDEWHTLEICAVIGAATWDLRFNEVGYKDRTKRRDLTIFTATRILLAGNAGKFRGNLGVCCVGKYCDPEPTHGAWGSQEGVVWPF